LNQVQIWPWPRFSRNFCCTNAVQIKSRVKLGLTLNRRGRRTKLWSSVQLSLCSGRRPTHSDPCHLCPDWWQFGTNCFCVDLLHPVSGYPSVNNYFNSLLGLYFNATAAQIERIIVILILVTFNNNEWVTLLSDHPQIYPPWWWDNQKMRARKDIADNRLKLFATCELRQN